MEDYTAPGAARGARATPAPEAPGPAEVAVEGPGSAPGRRALTRNPLLAGLLLAAIAGGTAWWLWSRGREETDDAQVDADIVAVSSRVPGTVTAVRVVDNQVVRQGDLLLELDPTDLQVAVAQARAAVAQAEAQIASDAPSVSITESSNRSALQQAGADAEALRSDLEASQRALEEAQAGERLARSRLDRARELLAGSSISQADYDEKETAHEVAVAAVASARQVLAGHQARLRAARSRQQEVTQNAPRQLASREAFVEARRANLELARAQLRQAELDLGYARVVAPADGVIGRKAVNPGERVQPGQQLLALTRSGDLWVTANFRETQVERMRAGQPAEIHVDALGRDFRGRVESFAGATGSRYSLMPPENASGNYVKVVQRLPVRLRFEPGQAGLELLRPGLSVEPTVELR